MIYRYETHCHSSQCSRCAHSSAQELVRAYQRAGFSGLVLTDHFILGNTAVDRTLPWEEQMRQYESAYLDAVKEAAPLDFDVIFGFEHACEGADYLCYGITPDILRSHPEIPKLSLQQFADLVHSNGGVLIQAHPYRWCPAGTPLRLELLDGIEVYNAGNASIANAAAREAAKEQMILTSGGDIHIATDAKIGTAGISLPYRITDTIMLAQALRHGDHALLFPI